MARTYGVGIIGLGMGRAHCQRIVGSEKRVRLAAVCDVDADRGRQTSETYGIPWYPKYADMLADPGVDIVLVATPTGMHAEHSIAAARAGKHVLCEKPLDVELPAARRIIAECRKAGVRLQVGFQNRCSQDSRRTRHDIEAGRLGRLLFSEMQLHWWRGKPGYFTKGGWRGTWRYDGGGAFMNQGIHFIDLLVWFMGRPVAVLGRCATTLFPIETEDVGMAIVTFESGARACLTATTTAHPIETDRTRIYLQGSEGRVVLSGSYTLDRTEVELGKARPGAGRPPRGTTLYADLAQAIDDGRDPISSGESALHSLAVIKAIYKSSKTGREVKLDLD
ncbi:MAG: Inositol 2-dehydrogenase/D-chiro-inositol 3-dehydrogenase [Phycisphaerae bacterium]|nr:Inositol 2-dehydrogenase/D-chiro-inositol 3-dehydrogenase [Phycisphaerae bacterium]